MDDITEKHLTLVERIRRYPVTDPAARDWVLVNIEAAFRRERAGRDAPDLPQLNSERDGADSEI